MENEALLNEFDYRITNSSLVQVDRIIKNTKGFNHVKKHLITLNDQLKPHLSFVSLSSSEDYFKIKNNATDLAIKNHVNELIKKWSDKYKIQIKKVDNKETYYVLGFEG